MAQDSSREPELPERYLEHLARRLNRHRLWNYLLVAFPPLVLLAYTVAVLFLFDWVGFGVLLFSTAAIVGVGLSVGLYLESTRPTKEKLARLIDDRVDGNEHFLTLATIDLSRAGPSVLAELRSHASRLLRRANFKQVFPYRVKRGAVFSLVVSILSIVLIQFFLTHPVLSIPDPAMLKKVPALAQRFARESGLQALASSGQYAAGELLQKIQSTAMVKQLMQQLRAQLGSGSQDGPQRGQGQNSSSTEQAEGGKGNRQQTNAAGTERVAGQDQGQGETGRTPGEEQGDLAKASNGAQGDSKPSQGGSRKGEPTPKPGGAGERDDPGRNGPNDGNPRDQAKRKKGRPGSGNPGEQIPQGKEPDRFHPPGEGQEGIVGGRFVTVALPKAISSGGGGPTAAGQQGGRSNTPIPISNVPLPPRNGPEMAGEKQHMPLEYEGLIQ